jgi:hypothetical protein
MMSVAFKSITQQIKSLDHFEQLELVCDVWDNWSSAAANSNASKEVLDILSQRAAQRDAGLSHTLGFDAMVRKLGVRV